MYLGNPTTVDLFTRFMVKPYDEREAIGVSTGFQTFFGRPAASNSQTYFSEDATVLDIDIIRGDEKTSKLILRGTISDSIGSTHKKNRESQFSSFARRLPLAEEEGVITADQLEWRVAGETSNELIGRKNRMRYIARKIFTEHTRKIVRMNERLAAQSILTGTMDSIIGTADSDLIYDFKRNPLNIKTLTTPWTDSSDPAITDIDDGCMHLREVAKIQADGALLGGKAMAAFLKSAEVAAKSDNRRWEFIRLGKDTVCPAKFSHLVEAGMLCRGMIQTPEGFELWLFTYIDGYTNESDAYTRYMPADQVLIFSSQARCDRYFGPGESMIPTRQREELYRDLFGMSTKTVMVPEGIKASGKVIDSRMFHADAYMANNNKAVVIRTQAAPLYAPVQTDAFYTMKSVA